MAVEKRKQQKKQDKPATAEKSNTAVETSNKPQELNPKTEHYEFGGPIGALGMIVGLPVIVLFFATCCDATGYPSQAFKDDWKSAVLSKLNKEFLSSLFDPYAFGVYVAFVAMLAVFSVALPGDQIPGTTLRDGTKLKYRMNGKK
jgi:hypothetical protein